MDRPQDLAEAERRHEVAVETYGWGSAEQRAARSELLQAQRDAAAEQGLPYAQPFDLGIKWDSGAPMPTLVSGLKTYVAFYLPPNFNFDGTNPRMRTADDEEAIGVVEFGGLTAVKMGPPNDEVLHRHPLWGHGLEFYAAHLVVNSPWIRELMAINEVHDRFDADHWHDVRHYLFAFHDETLECVADSHHVTIERGNLRAVTTRLAQRALRT